MNESWSNLRINQQRFQDDFAELCLIGKSGERGLSRTAFSESHRAARAWFQQKARQAGLEVKVDAAGNHSARLECAKPDAPTLLLGSHLDSVPDGGRYDGALGVLAGLEVLRCVKENQLQLPVHLEVIDFTDEEGVLVSFLGSFAFSGKLTAQDLANPRGDRQLLEHSLQQAGLTEQGVLSAKRDPASLAGYLELHVEQGPLLEKEGISIGVVTHISGISFYRLIYHGKAGHAGTIDMEARRDASQGASAFTLAARQIVLQQFRGCFANVGAARYEPGLFNVIPEKAVISLEFRAAYPQQFQQLREALLQRARQEAERFQLELEIEYLGQRLPVEMHPTMQDAVQQSAHQLGLSAMPIIARAGHDAQALADVCPTGMIFIPSVAGISHSPDEHTHWQDCLNGGNVLLQAALRWIVNWDKEEKSY